MTRSVICVSHETGAGGRDVATAVAERLGYRYVDEQVIAHAAERERLSTAELADVERRKSFLARMLTDFGRSGATPYTMGGLPSEVANIPTPDRLRGAITNAIGEIAAEGRVVIVSHAASFALAGDDMLRVLVVAPESKRRARIVTDGDLDDKAAAKAVADSDAGRREYLKQFYGVDRESPADYDIVVNTARLGPAQLAGLIASAAEL